MFSIMKSVFANMLRPGREAEYVNHEETIGAVGFLTPNLKNCKRIDPPPGRGLLAGQKFDSSVNTDVRKTWKRYGWTPIHEKMEDDE